MASAWQKTTSASAAHNGVGIAGSISKDALNQAAQIAWHFRMDKSRLAMKGSGSDMLYRRSGMALQLKSWRKQMKICMSKYGVSNSAAERREMR